MYFSVGSLLSKPPQYSLLLWSKPETVANALDPAAGGLWTSTLQGRLGSCWDKAHYSLLHCTFSWQSTLPWTLHCRNNISVTGIGEHKNNKYCSRECSIPNVCGRHPTLAFSSQIPPLLFHKLLESGQVEKARICGYSVLPLSLGPHLRGVVKAKAFPGCLGPDAWLLSPVL